MRLGHRPIVLGDLIVQVGQRRGLKARGAKRGRVGEARIAAGLIEALHRFLRFVPRRVVLVGSRGRSLLPGNQRRLRRGEGAAVALEAVAELAFAHTGSRDGARERLRVAARTRGEHGKPGLRSTVGGGVAFPRSVHARAAEADELAAARAEAGQPLGQLRGSRQPRRSALRLTKPDRRERIGFARFPDASGEVVTLACLPRQFGRQRHRGVVRPTLCASRRFERRLQRVHVARGVGRWRGG